MINTILRLPAVKKCTGLARSTIYYRIAQGTFPKPISLGSRSVGWIESELEAWLSNQIEQSRSMQNINNKSITTHRKLSVLGK